MVDKVLVLRKLAELEEYLSQITESVDRELLQTVDSGLKSENIRFPIFPGMTIG
ncbi:hypothetical protein QUF80_10150 [Desulfococcaceae bacterium HSG8]|nr:hypothetical protein [Desulfococcaceae bacterium HSG8]